MDMPEVVFFVLHGASDLGQEIARLAGMDVAPHEYRAFEDGEHKTRPLRSVEGTDAYILQNLYGSDRESINDRLCQLLFFVGTLKDAGARRVTVVTPYLCYARKDRRTKPHDPMTGRYVAQLMEAAGTDAVMVLDVHNPSAFENAFRCRTVALTAAPLFVDYVKAKGQNQLCVISPDPGGVKRAELFREALEKACGFPIRKGFADKHRSEGVVTGDLFAGDVKDAAALIIDDLASTGGTLVRAAKAARREGARTVTALVTHCLFSADSLKAILDPAIDRFVMTDSVVMLPLPPEARQKIEILPCAGLFSQAIRRLTSGQTLEDMFAF